MLQDAFLDSADRLPDKAAIVVGEQRTSFGALLRRATALARALQKHGVETGDRVLIMLESGPEFAVALHAVLLAGAVMVPVSTQTKTEKLAFLLQDTAATALLCQANLAPIWRAALPDAHALRCCLVADGDGTFDGAAQAWPDAGCSAIPAPVRRDEDALAALIYTSGSTGQPKGVMLSHRNMTSAWAAVQTYLMLREDDVIALSLPPVYSYGLYNLLMGLGIGATVVIERQAAFPMRLAQTLQRERATVLPGVPTLFSSLLGLAGIDTMDFKALRLVTNAAAALPVAHVQALRQLWPQASLYSMYGLSECMRASYMPPQDLDARPGSVGRGMPLQRHWLVDEAGCPLPNGASGELVVSGPHVMQGYWQRPQETAKCLRPGSEPGATALFTGDLFRSDEQGYLYFLARKDDIIKTRGEKVAPREVENAIHALPAVASCAVVGVADASLGQAVKAFVTLAPGCRVSERDIIKHCLARLESHMVPKTVAIVDELPRTESGKIRHASLR